MAGAAAATAASAAGGGRGLRGGSVRGTVGSGEDRKLDGGFLTGALGAGNFLLLVENDALEPGVAFVADVFVNGHGETSEDGFSDVKLNLLSFL